MSKDDDGGTTWFVVFAFLMSLLYYVFVYPFKWIGRKINWLIEWWLLK